MRRIREFGMMFDWWKRGMYLLAKTEHRTCQCGAGEYLTHVHLATLSEMMTRIPVWQTPSPF